MVGVAVAGGFAIMALIAVCFLVRRKKKRNIDSYDHPQYLPHPNFSVKSGFHKSLFLIISPFLND